MNALTAQPSQVPLTLHLTRVLELDDEQFFELCQRNRDLRIERTAQGEILIMPPVGGETSDRNAEITTELRLWARRDSTGRVFDSSGGFILPNGAVRSPDASWVELERLRALAPQDRGRFLPLVPAFVIELRSPSDPLTAVQAKMEEYIENGCRLGWLIDPSRRFIHVYRPGRGVEVLEEPDAVSGDPELPGFLLELAEVWSPTW